MIAVTVTIFSNKQAKIPSLGQNACHCIISHYELSYPPSTVDLPRMVLLRAVNFFPNA